MLLLSAIHAIRLIRLIAFLVASQQHKNEDGELKECVNNRVITISAVCIILATSHSQNPRKGSHFFEVQLQLQLHLATASTSASTSTSTAASHLSVKQNCSTEPKTKRQEEIKTKQFLIAMAKTNNLRVPLLVFAFAFAC